MGYALSMSRNLLVLVAGIVSVGCGAPIQEPRAGGSDCTTSCGARVLGAWDTCGQVEKTQELVLTALEPLYPVAKACEALAGSEIRMTDLSVEEFHEYWGAYGLYSPSMHLVVLPESAWLGYSMLAHEVVHLLDNRVGKFDDPDHATFNARGVDELNASVWDWMKQLVGSGEMYRY